MAAPNDRSATSTRNKIDISSNLGKNVRDNKLAIVDNRLAARNNRLAIINNRSVIVDNRLAAEISNKIDINNRSDTQTSNKMDARPGIEKNIRSGNRSDVNLIIDNVLAVNGLWDAKDIGDFRADLIKKFNNGITMTILAKLSYIILDKHVMNSSA